MIKTVSDGLRSGKGREGIGASNKIDALPKIWRKGF